MYLNNPGSVRDAFESTMNYGAHVKIVEKWLAKEVQSGELWPQKPRIHNEVDSEFVWVGFDFDFNDDLVLWA